MQLPEWSGTGKAANVVVPCRGGDWVRGLRGADFGFRDISCCTIPSAARRSHAPARARPLPKIK